MISNGVSAMNFAVARILSTSVTETCVTETYVRCWLDSAI